MEYGGKQMPMKLGKRLVVMIMLCSIAALAQTPPASAPPLPYGQPIGVETAKKAVMAALSEARKNSWFMAAAVVDTSGVLVYYEKMDNTQIGSATVSIGKARSAALFKRPTKAFQDMVAGGGAGLRILSLENAVAIEGGVPIIVNGQIIGAIGVSGDSSDHDGICATAGAAALK